ncbi:hypothetical protein [uncultured Thalassospira sp.]|uniref:hypothetical protein n=1 Tax=uncultured Thalassospira sp. TaxID=404382 RepID=UPI0030DA99D6
MDAENTQQAFAQQSKGGQDDKRCDAGANGHAAAVCGAGILRQHKKNRHQPHRVDNHKQGDKGGDQFACHTDIGHEISFLRDDLSM